MFEISAIQDNKTFFMDKCFFCAQKSLNLNLTSSGGRNSPSLLLLLIFNFWRPLQTINIITFLWRRLNINSFYQSVRHRHRHRQNVWTSYLISQKSIFLTHFCSPRILKAFSIKAWIKTCLTIAKWRAYSFLAFYHIFCPL